MHFYSQLLLTTHEGCVTLQRTAVMCYLCVCTLHAQARTRHTDTQGQPPRDQIDFSLIVNGNASSPAGCGCGFLLRSDSDRRSQIEEIEIAELLSSSRSRMPCVCALRCAALCCAEPSDRRYATEL
jgi:hypothetical protein